MRDLGLPKKCSKRPETLRTPPKLTMANKYFNLRFSLKRPEGGAIEKTTSLSAITLFCFILSAILMSPTPTNLSTLKILV